LSAQTFAVCEQWNFVIEARRLVVRPASIGVSFEIELIDLNCWMSSSMILKTYRSSLKEDWTRIIILGENCREADRSQRLKKRKRKLMCDDE
jgi:hypothetical protein